MKLNFINVNRVMLVLVITSGLTACTITKTQTAKTTDVYGAGVIQKPVIVDLEVMNTKVSGTAVSKTGFSINETKNNAVSAAIKSANADVLVEPTFVTEVSNKKTTVTATGFPASYKNFRQVTDKDTAILKVGITQKANVYEPAAVINKKGKAAGIVGGVVGLIGLILGIGLLATM